MTEQELAALEAAAKAATPGKRRVIIDGTCSGATPRIVTEALDEFGEPFDIAELSTSHVETAEARESSEMPGSYDEKPHRFELTSDGEQILADADFMAKADPTTIQSLIAACRKARALALEEAAKFERMFMAACEDLGAINEALGLDPNDGGAEPILAAIEELRSAALPVAERQEQGKLTLHGELVEVGRLEDENGLDGIVVSLSNGECITVKGMSMDQVKVLAPYFMDNISISFAAPILTQGAQTGEEA